MKFGPVHLTDVLMLVGNLSELSTFADGADAIIGSDLLGLTDFTIDYDEKILIFQPLKRSLSGPCRSHATLASLPAMHLGSKAMDPKVSMMMCPDILRC